MIKCRYPIATHKGTVNVNGYKSSAESMIGIQRDQLENCWIVTFLPTGTRIDSLFQAERYMAAPFLLARIERLELAAPIAWAALSALPFGEVEATRNDAFSWAIDAIKEAALQP